MVPRVTLRRVAPSLYAMSIATVTVALVACGSSPPPPPATPPPEEPEPPPEEPAPAPTTTTTIQGTDSRPPSTASYEEALSVPEPLDVKDDRAHLTDAQLTAPMRGVLT